MTFEIQREYLQKLIEVIQKLREAVTTNTPVTLTVEETSLVQEILASSIKGTTIP